MINELEISFSVDKRGDPLELYSLFDVVELIGFEKSRRVEKVEKTYQTLPQLTTKITTNTNDIQNIYYKRSVIHQKYKGYKVTFSVESKDFEGDVDDVNPFIHKSTFQQYKYSRGDLVIFIREDTSNKIVTVEIEHTSPSKTPNQTKIPDELKPTLENIKSVYEAIMLRLEVEESEILTEYINQFTHPDKLNYTEITNLHYKINKPIPLSWKDFKVSKLNNSSISYKIDGESGLLIFDKDRITLSTRAGKSVVVFKSEWESEIFFQDKVSFPVVYEGELISEGGFLYFYWHGSLNNIAFNNKYSNITTNYQKLAGLSDYFPFFRFVVKDFYTLKCGDEEGFLTFERALAEMDRINKQPTGFNVDGLTITLNSNQVLKWKPLDMFTIDLVYRAGSNSLEYGSEGKGFYEYEGEVLSDEELVDGVVYEFLINRDKTLKLIKPREDRNGIPNSSLTVNHAIKYINSPITRSDLTGYSSTPYRKYHNSVKRSLMSDARSRGGILLDVGSGKGGSLYSYSLYNLVFTIEPNDDYYNEFLERAEVYDKCVVADDVNLPELNELIKQHPRKTIITNLGRYLNKQSLRKLAELLDKRRVNVISFNFSIHFLNPVLEDLGFYKGKPSIKTQRNTLSAIITKHLHPSHAIIGLSLDYKDWLVRELTLTNNGETGGVEIQDTTYGKKIIHQATFNLPGFETVDNNQIEVIPELRNFLSTWFVKRSVNITPLEAEDVFMGIEWRDLSSYYSIFVLANKREVRFEQMRISNTFPISAVKGGDIYLTPLTHNNSPVYEIGSPGSTINSCVLSSFYSGFWKGYDDVVSKWGGNLRNPKVDVDKWMRDFGLVVVSIYIKDDEIKYMVPAIKGLVNRYIYLFNSGDKYSTLAIRTASGYQTSFISRVGFSL